MAKFLLRQILKEHKISNREFARRCKTSVTQAKRFLKDGYDPKLSRLDQFAKVLGMRIRDLFKE